MRGRFIPLLLAAVIFAVALGVTYGLWKNSRVEEVQKLQKEFDFRARETIERIGQRMATYEQVARGAKGFLLGDIDPPHDEFRFYVESLRLSDHYPGIQGLAISRIVQSPDKDRHIVALRKRGFPAYTIRPAGQRDIYTAITHIEPFSGLNLRAIGFDMLNEPIRQTAMLRARDTGQAAMSGKVKLIQENGQAEQAGVVMYLPVYKRGMPVNTLEQRQQAILGWVGAPFRMNDLMRGLQGERSADLHLAIYDNGDMSDQARLYANHPAPKDGATPLFSASREIDIAGRPWLIAIHSTPGFEARITAENSRFIAIAGIATSILLALLVWVLATGRRRALALAMDMTRELRASEFRWKYALEGAGDGVWDSDLRTGEVVFSRRWREMLGYRQEEIPNHRSSWEKLLHPDDKEKVMQNLAAYLRGKSPAYSAEFRMRCKDGGWRWILARGTVVLRDEKGMPLRMIGTHSDISQRKEAEQREAERVRSLEETRTALHHAQKLEAVGKLTGGVAHDFNNVLQIIASNLHLLQRYLTGDAQANKRLESAMGAVERGAKLSTQLLTFARRQPLQPVVIDLRALIDNMNDLLRQAMGAAIDIAVVADNDLWKTKVDPDQLSNVVLNLALNSRDAMKEAGRLTIRMCNKVIAEGDALLPDLDKGEYVLIEISDTGSGMPPDVIEHAFEPFYTTKRQGEGTGLGLSTAYGFAKQSGGHIRIESEVGVGTTLRIYLPRSLESETVKTEDAGVAADGGSEAILVVEDDPEVRLAAVEMLSELGYRAVEAGSGDEALDVLRGGSPVDLIFTDVVMPGSVRGTKLAEKAHQIRPGVPILFTSGYTQNEIMKNGMLDPDVPLIGKPYKKEQLAHKLRELLPARQAAS